MALAILEERPSFCASHSSFIIVSTYQLDSATSSRSGSLHFFNPDLTPHRKAITVPAGVFRFQIVGDDCVSALTDGSLNFVNLSDFSTRDIKVTDEMLTNISVCGDKAAVTTDKGSVILLDYPSGELISNWTAHKLKISPFIFTPCEVWSVALSHNDLCTGGENAELNFWDLRTWSKTNSITDFNAGVTFIRWLDDNHIVTGSYDQEIRVFDIRNPQRSMIEKEMPGGVWHIESRTFNSKKYHLAACMYGGYTILDDEWTPLHDSKKIGANLLYGASFIDNSTIVCTTFNDFTVATHNIPTM